MVDIVVISFGCYCVCRLSGCLRSFVFFEDLQQAVLKLAVLDYALIIALNTGAVY